MPGIGHDGIQRNLEPRWHLDAFEVFLDGIGVGAGLRHHRNVQVGGGDLHLLELVNIGRQDRLLPHHHASHADAGESR